MKHICILLVLLSVSAYAQQVVLQPWTEVYGTVNGQQLGKYVTGITPTSNLPYRGAISKIGTTGIYGLSTPTDTIPQLVLFGEKVVTANLNSDGYVDAVANRTSNGRDTAFIYWGTPTGLDTLTPLRIPSESSIPTYQTLAVGDVNNDGLIDLIIGDPVCCGGAGKVSIFLNPVITAIPDGIIVGDSSSRLLGESMSVGDVNNDGFNDLFIRGRTSSYNCLNVYWGVRIDTLNLTLGLRMRTASINSYGLACFDVNGDGRDDLLWTTEDSVGYRYINVHYGRSYFQTTPDLRFVKPFVIANFGYVLADAGDMNGDSYHDLVVGCPDATSTGDGLVIEYSGGPQIDPYFDAAIGQDYGSLFGQSISGVGDINGDGLSDIIVGAPRYPFFPPIEFDKGYWGIFKGDSTIRVTNVKQIPTLPTRFALQEAFPNPFNPVTTIAFTMQQSAMVTIEVFDQLGRHVRMLTNQAYSPGSYTAEFDATGFSSGVYYYRMTVQQNGTMVFQQTKHFTLLK